MKPIDLPGEALELKRRFGEVLQAPYVPGKTMFRDALCEHGGLSQADAEAICDSLEQAGMIRFERTELRGPEWTITPSTPAR